MLLCHNRAEGFGPHSALSAHLPTSCFADVIVIPLATWIYLVVALVVGGLWLLSARRAAPAGKEVVDANRSPSRAKTVCCNVLDSLYYLLIVAMIAMNSLVIARLSVADLGIGLLPFTYAGLLLALALHVSSRKGMHSRASASGGTTRRKLQWTATARLLNALFWILLMTAGAIEVAVYANQTNKLGPRKGRSSKYPLSDEIIDNSVMIGVEFVLMILEAF